MNRKRIYLTPRLFPIFFLILHLGIRLAFPTPTPLSDLIIYNATPFLAAAALLRSPLFNSRGSLLLTATGLGSWAIGSTLSTWQSFYPGDNPNALTLYINAGYTLFYPCMILALFSSTTLERLLTFTQLLDALISSLGLSALIAALFIKPAMITFDGSTSTVFFTLLFPAGDVVLLATSVLYFLLLPKSGRSFLLLAGFALFATTDIYFLIASATTGYPFASIIDDGWLLGLICIAEAFYHRPKPIIISDLWSSFTTTASLILATIILATAALHPSAFVAPVIAVAIATIAFSFLRMVVALRSAHAARDDRELAHLDELTSLPNRRRFLAELAEIERSGVGTVLLLDLDGFKPINDERGHDVGDQLLRHISRRFERALAHGDLLARLGGDEFGAIVRGDGIEAAEALLAALSYPVHLVSGSVKVGASIGMVTNDGRGELLKRCDSAMYAAKRSGGGVKSWGAL